MITSLSQDVGRYSKRGQITPLDVAYHKLNEFIDKIDEKILNRLQLVQHVYLQDYKQQVKLMSQQLATLRSNLDTEVINQKSNEKMFLLEEERDFFRAQVMKLNRQINQFVEQNKSLKKTIIDIKVENNNLKTITFNYEKKVQKLQNERNQIASQNMKRETSVPVLSKATIKQESQASLDNSYSVNSSSNVKLNQRSKPMIIRAKTYSKIQTVTKASFKRYEQLNNKDQIIDQCIKQIKKDIFFRTSDQKGFNDLAFDQFGKIPFQKFVRTDKKNLILKILASQKMLEDFNEFLIARNSNAAMSRMVRTKVGDEKFNDKFLTDLKRSFSKKILDLKSNQEPTRMSASRRV